MQSVLETEEPDESSAARDDFFETLGFHLAQVRDASPWRTFRYRFPWLLATVASGTACALLAGIFEATLARSLVVAFFLTMVLALNESVSMQSMSVTIQTLHSARVTWGWFVTALRREILTALLLAVACGALVGLIVWFSRNDILAAFVIGGSIAASLITACLFGLGVPSLLHRWKFDPKIAAGPITLALADFFALALYFTSAWLVLG
jgi:magnesium transporter